MLDEYMKGGEQISFLYPRYSIALAFPPKALLPYHGNSEGQHRTKFTLHFVFSLEPNTPTPHPLTPTIHTRNTNRPFQQYKSQMLFLFWCEQVNKARI